MIMFSIFNKRNKVIVDCFTYDRSSFELTPIIQSYKAMPTWWKELENYGIGNSLKSNNDEKNMKKCYGFTELYKKSLTLECWTDINIKVLPNNEGYRYYIATDLPPEDHPRRQYGTLYENDYHIKLLSPWRIHEKTGIKFAFMPAVWELDKLRNITILSGIIEFQMNLETNVNMFLRQPEKDAYEMTINLGQPLVQIIPLTEKDIELKTHLVNLKEFEKMNSVFRSFRGHREVLRLKKRNENRKDKKCPF